jgi:hypothetical protein
MQASVDAINANYNAMQQTTIDPQKANVTGTARAIDARSGLLGSDFGAANEAGAAKQSDAIQAAFDAERQGKLADITNQINSRADAEIAARRTAAVTNAGNYAQYLQKAQADARQNVTDLAQIGAILTPEMKASLLKDSGYDPMTFDAIFNANRQHGLQADYTYTNLGNGTVLRTGKLANGQAVPNQTFQYQLGPNDEFTTAADGTPLIVTKQGNAITSVKIAPGFNQAQFAPKPNAPVVTYPGAIVLQYNPATKKYEQSTVGGGNGSSGPAPAGGFRTDRNNNPTAMTTDVAAQSGLVEGVDYTQGDPFTGGDGKTYYTAKLMGDPVETTIKAIDQGGFYTQSGQARWSYLSQIPEAANWQTLTHDQKVGVVQKMYQQEGGDGSLTGPKPFDSQSPVDNLARTWLQTGSSSRSRQDAPEGTIEARGRELAASFGLPADFNPATASASVKADVGALVDLTSQQANTQKSLETVDSNGQLLLKGMQTAGINQNAPFINEMQNAANRKLIGSGDLVAYQNSLNTLQAEYAKLLMGRGATTDSANHDAQAALPGNITAAALQQVIQRIHDEGTNVLTSLSDTINKKKQDISGIGGTASSTASGSNFSVTTPDGQTYSFKDQASMNQFKQDAGIK